MRVDGTRLERVAEGWSFPTSVAFDGEGAAYVAESGLPFGGAPPGGRVWRLGPEGGGELIAEGLSPPVTGMTWHGGALYVSEGGPPARISRLDAGGESSILVDGLPGPGNYHVNMVAVGPDGRLYFGQGAMTNSAIVGLDSYEIGWLARLPHGHDVPGMDVVLAGCNAHTRDPRAGRQSGDAVTGAFVPFGTATTAGQRVPGGLPCTAAVMRCATDGSDLELIAWGLRNAFGLGFLDDGRLVAIDQGADDRGSRPIGNAPDLLYDVRAGAWYGWPDFIGGQPVTDPRFRPARGDPPEFVLANHHDLPPPEPALLEFPPHAAAVKFTQAPASFGALAGQLFVALFGDEAPMTAPAGPRVGRSVVRVDPRDWTMHPFVDGPFHRPIDVRCWPGETALAVLDFGQFEMSADGMMAEPGTGALWKATLDQESGT